MSEEMKPEVLETSDVAQNVEETVAEAPVAEAPVAEEIVEEAPAEEIPAEEPVAEAAEEPVAEEIPGTEPGNDAGEEPAAEPATEVVAEEKAEEKAEEPAAEEKAEEVVEESAAEPDAEEKAEEKAEEVVEEPAAEGKAEEKAEKPEPTLGEKVGEKVGDAVGSAVTAVVNFGEKTLAELSGMFQSLTESVDRMKRSKEAEAIKSAFYKRLSKEKADAGLDASVDEPYESDEIPGTEPGNDGRTEPEAQEESTNPFAAIENGFKALYNKYKKERTDFNRQIEQEKEANLAAKQAVIDDLKALVETQDDMKDTWTKFREIQSRWREIGPVPQQNYQDINRQYQFQVEKFYDMVQINRDLRDLDFRKNLEAKEQFCEQAEELAASEDSVGAFKELQKLHEQWKEFGPVAKEYRESIWERFRAATAVINRKYQSHFEGMKAKQEENLAAKTALCEKVEAIAAMDITSSNEWNAQSKAIEDIQQEWRKIGFATKKENQKIYDRFRAACDAFFARKREFYNRFKDDMNANMEKKMSIIEKAEALKDSREWKKTSEALIELQRQWKEIGAVPRKKSEQLWKRFRAACDAFFDEKSKHSGENNFYQNLEAKRALIAEIEGYELKGDESDTEAMNAFAARWKEIGFVPFKEKEKINAAYNAAVKAKFPRSRGTERRGGSAPARTEKDRLVQKYNALQQEIATYENNIGFFSLSKNSESIIEMMKGKIEAAKAELEEIGGKIRALEDEGE